MLKQTSSRPGGVRGPPPHDATPTSCSSLTALGLSDPTPIPASVAASVRGAPGARTVGAPSHPSAGSSPASIWLSTTCLLACLLSSPCSDFSFPHSSCSLCAWL